MSVYDNIDMLIKERHLSRRKLARLAGIKETTLAACFSRKPEHFPSKYAFAIADVLNVDVSEIYGMQPLRMPISEALEAVKSMNEEDVADLPQRLRGISERHVDEWLQLRQVANQFAEEDIGADLQRFLNAYKLLNEAGRKQVLQIIEDMTQIDRFQRAPTFKRIL